MKLNIGTMIEYTPWFVVHRGGILTEYSHNEIEINVTNANENITGTYYGDWGMQVRVLETGEVYSDGEFVANLLYQGCNSIDIFSPQNLCQSLLQVMLQVLKHVLICSGKVLKLS